MDNVNVPKESDQLNSLNRLLALLVAFIIGWSVFIFFYVQKRTDDLKPTPQIVYLDPNSGTITNTAYANLFPHTAVSHPSGGKPLYEEKSSYEVMDYVIINYFFVEGLVVDKKGDNYTVMYKDYNRVLQRIIVPRQMLLVPAPGTAIAPTSLIAP